MFCLNSLKNEVKESVGGKSFKEFYDSLSERRNLPVKDNSLLRGVDKSMLG